MIDSLHPVSSTLHDRSPLITALKSNTLVTVSASS